MMDHRAVRQAFDSLWRRELHAPQRLTVESHLAACADCRQAYAAHVAFNAHLQQLTVSDPGPGFTAGVMAALPSPVTSPVRWRVIAAAGVTALLVVGTTLWLPAGDPGHVTVAVRRLLAAIGYWQQLGAASLAQGSARLPWQALSQGVWASAVGLLLAFGPQAVRELVPIRRSNR